MILGDRQQKEQEDNACPDHADGEANIKKMELGASAELFLLARIIKFAPTTAAAGAQQHQWTTVTLITQGNHRH